MKGNVKRTEMITLHNVDLGNREFPAPQAQNILAHKSNTGLWVLPKGSKYKFENGELIRSAGTSQDSNAQQ